MTPTQFVMLDSTTYGTPSGNYDGSSMDWYGDAVRAANYYRGFGGLQTVTISVTDFVGEIRIEASMDTDPGAVQATWFHTATYGPIVDPLTDYHPVAIQGNFAWMRVHVVGFENGTINQITITY